MDPYSSAQMEWIRQLENHGYRVISTIGQGGYASVLLVESQKYEVNTRFAAKITKQRLNMSASNEPEIKMLVQLDHPHIVNLYEYFEEAGYLYMILEYCPNGSLKDLVDKEGQLSYRWCSTNLYKIAEALMVCHEMGIAHRDIKPENILIDAYGRPKIADFGLGIDSVDPGQSITSTAGSLFYSPPEFFLKSHHDPFKSDIWSLGILFYYALTGSIPWREKKRKAVIREISAATFFLSDEELGVDMKRLLSRMLDSDPSERPCMTDIVNKYMTKPCEVSLSVLPELYQGAYGAPAPKKTIPRALNMAGFMPNKRKSLGTCIYKSSVSQGHFRLPLVKIRGTRSSKFNM